MTRLLDKRPDTRTSAADCRSCSLASIRTLLRMLNRHSALPLLSGACEARIPVATARGESVPPRLGVKGPERDVERPGRFFLAAVPLDVGAEDLPFDVRERRTQRDPHLLPWGSLTDGRRE